MKFLVTEEKIENWCARNLLSQLATWRDPNQHEWTEFSPPNHYPYNTKPELNDFEHTFFSYQLVLPNKSLENLHGNFVGVVDNMGLVHGNNGIRTSRCGETAEYSRSTSNIQNNSILNYTNNCFLICFRPNTVLKSIIKSSLGLSKLGRWK